MKRTDEQMKQALIEDEKRRNGGEPVRQSRLVRRSLQEVEGRRVRWLLPGLVALRVLTLVAGVGGLGKSTWAMGLAARVSRGDLLDGPADVLIVSAEDVAEEVLRPRLEAAQGDLARVHEITVPVEQGGLVCLPKHLDDLELQIAETQAALVVIDPIVAHIDLTHDTHRDQPVRVVLGGLARIMAEHDCAGIIVGHLNKAPGSEPFLRVANSGAFWNASRSVVLITPDPDEPETHRLVSQQKANYSRLAPVERHVIEEILLEGDEQIVTSRMTFAGVVDVDRADVLAPNAVARGTKLADAVAFLSQLLADREWHLADGLKQLAAARGISEATLKNAKSTLGAEHTREGFQGPTSWRLPPVSQRSTPSSEPTVSQLDEPLDQAVLSEADSQSAKAQRSEPTGEPTEPTERFPPAPVAPPCGNPQHLGVWLARDDKWRCNSCDRPLFALEVVRYDAVAAAAPSGAQKPTGGGG